eukprot:1159670-Pelagomonas_calceolata.AAC.6
MGQLAYPPSLWHHASCQSHESCQMHHLPLPQVLKLQRKSGRLRSSRHSVWNAGYPAAQAAAVVAAAAVPAAAAAHAGLRGERAGRAFGRLAVANLNPTFRQCQAAFVAAPPFYPSLLRWEL